MIGEYADDSKEILKELGGLDENDDDELEEDENGHDERKLSPNYRLVMCKLVI